MFCRRIAHAVPRSWGWAAGAAPWSAAPAPCTASWRRSWPGSRDARTACSSPQARLGVVPRAAPPRERPWRHTNLAVHACTPRWPAGFAANVAVVTSLAGLAGSGGVCILSDSLNHASIVDGARLAVRGGAGVTLKVYRHNDMAHLEQARAAAPTAALMHTPLGVGILPGKPCSAAPRCLTPCRVVDGAPVLSAVAPGAALGYVRARRHRLALLHGRRLCRPAGAWGRWDGRLGRAWRQAGAGAAATQRWAPPCGVRGAAGSRGLSVRALAGRVACCAAQALARLRARYGFLLAVDEAHATLVLGEHGAGAAEAMGVADQVRRRVRRRRAPCTRNCSHGLSGRLGRGAEAALRAGALAPGRGAATRPRRVAPAEPSRR